MNKYFLKTFFAGVGIMLLSLYSCKKHNAVVDQDAIIPPPFAKFNVVPSPIYTTDSTATYYVKSTGETFKLPVGITNVSDKDRTVKFTYTSNSATQGVEYNAPTSITIPANSALVNLEISGLFAGINVGETDTLKVQIEATDDIAMSPYKNHFFIYMRKSCPINFNDFEGAYPNTYDNAGSYGPYATTVTPGSITMVTPTSATFTVENIWDPGYPVVTTVNADWTLDPDHPVVTIPDQEYIAPADVWITGTATFGTFSACDQTITLRYTLYDKPSGAPIYADQETILGR
ncbi:MAG: hypothetical protein QM737_10960 [Ferruginibacter sp.]